MSILEFKLRLEYGDLQNTYHIRADTAIEAMARGYEKFAALTLCNENPLKDLDLDEIEKRVQTLKLSNTLIRLELVR